MRRQITYPKSVKKIGAILEVILTYYAVGYYALAGLAEFPDAEELNEMLSKLKASCSQDLGVAVRTENHSTVESYVLAIESAEEMIALIEHYGGTDKITEAFNEYIKAFPENARILKQIGSGGKAGALSLEEIAEENYIDVKTLRVMRRNIMLGIALYMVYSETWEAAV